MTGQHSVSRRKPTIIYYAWLEPPGDICFHGTHRIKQPDCMSIDLTQTRLWAFCSATIYSTYERTRGWLFPSVLLNIEQQQNAKTTTSTTATPFAQQNNSKTNNSSPLESESQSYFSHTKHAYRHYPSLTRPSKTPMNNNAAPSSEESSSPNINTNTNNNETLLQARPDNLSPHQLQMQLSPGPDSHPVSASVSDHESTDGLSVD